MLWTEKYRPKKLSEVVGQYNFTIDAESWVEQGNMPNVLLYGIAGVGKTAAGIALANDILKEDVDNNFFEINASDDRRLETKRLLRPRRLVMLRSRLYFLMRWMV